MKRVYCNDHARAAGERERGIRLRCEIECERIDDRACQTHIHERPDTNHDGYVSRNEAQTAGVTDYSFADKNADGLLDADEFATASAEATHESHSSSSSMSEPSKPPADSSSMTHSQ